MCSLSSPIWRHWSNGQRAPIFVSTQVFIPHSYFNIHSLRLQARKVIPLVILHILYLSIFFMWHNSAPPWASGGLPWEELLWSRIPTEKLGAFTFVTFTWFLGSLFVSTMDHPFDFLSTYSIVSTTLHNHGHETKTDNPNFKSLMSHYLMLPFPSLRWNRLLKVFPGNLLVEFIASLSILSTGYGWLSTITIKSLVLVLIASLRNEFLYFRPMNSCLFCWKFKKAPPTRAWQTRYVSWTRKISFGIQNSWVQFYS